MNRRLIAITGSAGLLGSVLREKLADDYDLLSIDKAACEHSQQQQIAMQDLDAVVKAFDGCDVVIDLAATPGSDVPWNEVIDNNIVATRNALEAARRVGAKRLIFASSNYVVMGHEKDEPYKSIIAGNYEGITPGNFERLSLNHPLRPESPYAVGKAFGEAACRYYSDEFGLSTICLRIGTVKAEDKPSKPRHFAKFLSHRDFATLVKCCIEADEGLKFGIFYGVSENTWNIWDNQDAQRTLGFQPLDNAESWR